MASRLAKGMSNGGFGWQKTHRHSGRKIRWKKTTLVYATRKFFIEKVSDDHWENQTCTQFSKHLCPGTMGPLWFSRCLY